MATALSFNTAKSMVISLLQASRTPYATTVDGSNQSYASDSEISGAILNADFECATLIANTPGHPYAPQFIAGSPITITGNTGNSPIRNGMVVQVTGQVGAASTTTFTNTDISITTDLVTKAAHGLVTGQQVQLTAGGTRPTPLELVTTYYISVASSSTYGFSTTIYNAKAGTLIDISNAGSGTNTLTTQFTDIYEADSKDTVVEAVNSPYLFAQNQGDTAGWWFIEADKFYCSCPSSKIYYTDTTLTASPQCPEPYLFAVVSGALSKLYKDGADGQQLSFYTQQYLSYMQQIQGGARIVPEIVSYT